MSDLTLTARPLTREAFAPFGDVIETRDAHHYPINNGTTERYHDLATVDVLQDSGRPLINIFRAQPQSEPVNLWVMERHPLASQAFIPMTDQPFLVVVSDPAFDPTPDRLQAFITDGSQGVNYHRGVWHHPVLALKAQCDFVVVDRGGSGHNCDEIELPVAVIVDYTLPDRSC